VDFFYLYLKTTLSNRPGPSVGLEGSKDLHSMMSLWKLLIYRLVEPVFSMVIDSTISESDPRPNIFDFLLRRSNNENLKSIFLLTKDLSQIGGLHECLKREHLVASSNGLYCKLKMLHFHWLIQKWRQRAINRLNSGNFRIFKPREWNLNFNSSDYRAAKIIYNDINLEPISWELDLKNPLSNICVGVWVGGHPRANLWSGSKDAHKNSSSFGPSLMKVGHSG